MTILLWSLTRQQGSQVNLQTQTVESVHGGFTTDLCFC